MSGLTEKQLIYGYGGLTFGVDRLCKHGNVAPCSDCDPYAVARTTDPATSHAAAKSVTDLTGKQQRVYEALLGMGPMTDEQLVSLHQIRDYMSESGARTRRKELCRLFKVKDSGQRVKLSSGRLAIRWMAVE